MKKKTLQPEEPKYLPNGIVDELQHLQFVNNETLIKLQQQLGKLCNSTYMEVICDFFEPQKKC